MTDNPFPLISVIILNYNGLPWLERCLDSLKNQTINERIEIIVTDNLSTDGSDRLAEALIEKIPNGRFIQNGANLGFCEGNNRGAAFAKGKYLFFLNNDAWLEQDTLELLAAECEKRGAAAAGPLILNYDDNSFQSSGAEGFDIFGLPSGRRQVSSIKPLLMPEGCAYFVTRNAFETIGRFDSEFFMYADEYDLSWRLWICGYSIISVPVARVHHRGAANVNPAGGEKVVETRTSDTKRYYANRNCLLVLLKNAEHLLLSFVLLQFFLLVLEALVSMVLVRRWSYIRRAYIQAVSDCFKMRRHLFLERKALAELRKVGDFRMLQFLRIRLNRFDEFKRILAFGLPKVVEK